jgi:two-component sensor histidine kinase
MLGVTCGRRMRLADGCHGRAEPRQPARLLEANHRIANNLALIAGLMRFQASKLPEEALLPARDVRGWLQQMSLRIDTVGRLHRLLTHDDGGNATVDLATYLREISDAAMSALSMQGQTETLIELETNCAIPAKQATAVGLLIDEALTNALKYSHPTGVPGKIAITSRRTSERALVIEVADDGVGLPEGFDPHTSESTGVALMRALANQLNARLGFEQGSIGLCIRLELPLA